MTKPDDPAHPHNTSPHDSDWCCGLTKREWFAGLAMQGLACTAYQQVDQPRLTNLIASLSVKLADALIVELAKETK